MYEKNFIKDIYLMFSCFPFESSQRLQMCIVLHLLMMACVNVETEKEKEQVWSNEKNNKTYKREREREIVMRVAWCRSHALPYTIS